MSQDESSPIKLIMMNKLIILASIIVCLLLGIVYDKNIKPLYKTELIIKLNHKPPFVADAKIILADLHLKILSKEFFERWQKAEQKNLLKYENSQPFIKQVSFSRFPDKRNEYLNSITITTTVEKFNLITDYLSHINEGITSKYASISKKLQEKYAHTLEKQSDKPLTLHIDNLLQIDAHLMVINNKEPMFTILSLDQTETIKPKTHIIIIISITLGFILGILLSILRRYSYKE